MFHQKPKEQSQVVEISPDNSEKIRIMPMRFQTEEHKKKGSAFVIIIPLIIFVVLLVVAIVLYFQMKANGQNPSDGLNVNNSPPLVDTPAPTPEPTPTPAPTPIVDSTLEPSPTPEIIITSPLDTSDIDSDNLTGEEEKLFATNSNNSDTDSDGYKDYNEIISGYDPRQSSKTLLESGLVNEYLFQENIKTYYPSSWIVKDAGILKIFDTKRGDSISVAFNDNNKRLSPLEWIKENDTSVDANQLIKAELISKLDSYKTTDGLKYYVFSQDSAKVITITYRPSILTSIAFLSTFQMMVHSVRF